MTAEEAGVDPSLEIDALVCDLDGVIFRGAQPIPGAADAVERLRKQGVRFLFATNNATRTVEQYREKLSSIGVAASDGELITSAIVTVEEIVRRGWSDRSVFLIGGAGIRAALLDAGFDLLDGMPARDAEVVIVSGDPDFSYDSLRTAAFAVRKGAAFLATNDDTTFPASDGLWPGAGALIAGVEVASGRPAEVMGKPHPPMMEAIARRLEGAGRIAVVGDQPQTDLAGAQLMGWTTILVLSGVTTAEEATALVPKPDLVLDSLADLRVGSTG